MDIDASAMEVAFAVRQTSYAFARARRPQFEFDPRIVLVEPGDRIGEDGAHPGRTRRDPQTASAPRNGVVDLAFRHFDFTDDLPRVAGDHVASAVSRTPVGIRSNKRPPNWSSSLAITRESAG